MLRTLCLLLAVLLPAVSPLTAQITVSFPASVSPKPLDGRVLLLLSTDPAKEPRMQIDDSPRSQIVFGTTVDRLAPDQAVTITNEAAGYPIRSLEQVPAGDYYVQAVLNIYQTFHRSNGTTVKLAPDRGEGQHWNLAPGNLYSKPVKVHIDDHTKLATAYWHDHYDLYAILQRDWDKLGPLLQGKIHLYVGSADTYFLNDADYLMQDFLDKTGSPGYGVPYEGEVKYGDRAEHCWNGDPNLPNALSRLHYNTMYLPKIMERIQKTAPPDADMSWKY